MWHCLHKYAHYLQTNEYVCSLVCVDFHIVEKAKDWLSISNKKPTTVYQECDMLRIINYDVNHIS